MEEHRLTPEILESRKFYDTLRHEVVPCMTLVAVCDEGRGYYWDDFVAIMILVGENFVALTYGGDMPTADWLQMIRNCYKTLNDPTLMTEICKSLCYFASIEIDTEEYKLHEYRGGDWTGIYSKAKRNALKRLYYLMPDSWPQSYRETIQKLNLGRGEDDYYASRHEKFVTRLNHMLYNTKFRNTAGAFDTRYGRILPPENGQLSVYELPIETYNVGHVEPITDNSCAINLEEAKEYIKNLHFDIKGENRIVSPSGSETVFPLYGLAALAFLIKSLPGVAEDGKESFAELLSCLPECNFDFASLRDIYTCIQLGSGIVLIKLLFEGMLGLGGDLFPSHELRRSLWYFDPYFHGIMVTALDVQRNVILKLIQSESGKLSN